MLFEVSGVRILFVADLTGYPLIFPYVLYILWLVVGVEKPHMAF